MAAEDKQLSGLVAPALFISVGLSQYVGAAIAITLFALMTPLGVVWWRLAVGGVALVLIWRPWKVTWTWARLGMAVAFGGALAVMNSLFYEAMSTIPLGTTVSVEFLGPVAVAVARGRGARVRVASLLALVGVVLIGGWGLDLTDPAQLRGFLFALGAAAAWATYILLGSHVAKSGSPGAYLGVGLLVAAVGYLPFFHGDAFGFPFSGGLLAALLGVGLLSSGIPYSLEAFAFRRMLAATFALLTALLPATSTLVAAVMLRQIPSAAELVGLVLISAAVWLAGRENKE